MEQQTEKKNKNSFEQILLQVMYLVLMALILLGIGTCIAG